MATVSDNDISSVRTELIAFLRERDAQGMTNKDHPLYESQIFALTGFTKGVQTTFTVDIGDVSNFSVDEVVKFVDIADSTLQAELQHLSPYQTKIVDITSNTITINLKSDDFSGSYSSGYVTNTYNREVLNNVCKNGIIDFELRSGFKFDSDSYLHIQASMFAARSRLLERSSVEEAALYKIEFENTINKIKAGIGIYDDSDNYPIASTDSDFDFQSDAYKRKWGLL